MNFQERPTSDRACEVRAGAHRASAKTQLLKTTWMMMTPSRPTTRASGFLADVRLVRTRVSHNVRPRVRIDDGVAAEHRASVRGRHGSAPRHGAVRARALRVAAVGVRVRGRAGRVPQEPVLARHRRFTVVLRVRYEHGDVPVHGSRVVRGDGAVAPQMRLRRVRGQFRVPHSVPRHVGFGRELEGGQHRHHRLAYGLNVEGHGVRAELHGRG